MRAARPLGPDPQVDNTLPPYPRPRHLKDLGGYAFLALLWLLHWLPLSGLSALGRGLGALLWRTAGSRRRVVMTNLALCFPEHSPAEREALAREHFALLGRSFLERGLLWFGSQRRLERLVHIEGDVGLAERSAAPVMVLIPHFLGLDVAGGPALQLGQRRPMASIYQAQSHPVMDVAFFRGRARYGLVELHARQDSARGVMRRVRQGWGFINLPDMDFGLKDSAFVSFFGQPAATLLAPSRMARALGMVVQPVVVTLLPGGQGYRVRFEDPLPNFPSDDPVADSAALNRWLEARIREQPTQYFWVHKRFKTRPEGLPGVY